MLDTYFVVRSPGFEPGSPAWEAEVLDQARLRPLLFCDLELVLGFLSLCFFVYSCVLYDCLFSLVCLCILVKVCCNYLNSTILFCLFL